MSEQNVEILETLHEAINRRDVVRALECLHPGVELRPAIPAPDMPSQFLGRDGAREFLEGISDAWRSMTVEIKETIQVSENQILAVERWRASGRQGIEADVEVTDLYAFRNGLISGVDGFRDKMEALEAAGLSE
jgi:ketosteroid isomerase-like protein